MHSLVSCVQTRENFLIQGPKNTLSFNFLIMKIIAPSFYYPVQIIWSNQHLSYNNYLDTLTLIPRRYKHEFKCNFNLYSEIVKI